MIKKVFRVNSAHVFLLATNPPSLVIQAEAITNTVGWDNGQLIPYTYGSPPSNGIYEFDFLGDEPEPGQNNTGKTSVLKSVLTPWQPFPSSIKGVKINAAANTILIKAPFSVNLK